MEQAGPTPTSRQSRPLKFIELDTGCYVCISHKTNQDGYFQFYGRRNKLEQFHRIIWEIHRGPITEGYEINHLCHNRACQNVDHMECITSSEHKAKTSKERYMNRRYEAYNYWVNTGCNGTHLSSKFKVCKDTGYRWIREWVNG